MQGGEIAGVAAAQAVSPSKNQFGDRETATFRPRSAGPTEASFCWMIKQVVASLPTGKTMNPVG